MKMKLYNALSILLIVVITSCNGQSSNNTKNKGTSTKNSTAKYTEGQDYVEFKRARILDKVGFTNPVEACSILLPNDWKLNGDILWNAPGKACAGNNMSIKSTSPDGKYSFELLPNELWAYIDDPQIAEFSRQQQFPKYCSYGQPMNAMDYFKNKFAPNELGNPQIIELIENSKGQQILAEKAEKNRQKMLQYGSGQVQNYTSCITATVKLSPKEEAIVFCGIIISENTILNQYNGTSTKSYTTLATERMVFKYPVGEKEKASNMLSVIMGSIRTNDAWKDKVDEFWHNVTVQNINTSLGKIRMMDAQTAQMGRDAINRGKQNLDAMDANMRSWEAKQQSQDRMHTNFIKTIREVENYSDATGKVELVSGYNHAWSRSDGSSFIMSDNPNFDPSSVFQDQRWKEMKKVE